MKKVDMANPDPSWIESNVWDGVCNLTGCGIAYFEGLAESFTRDTAAWKAVFDDNAPQTAAFPAPYDGLEMSDPVKGLQRMAIIRCLRFDKSSKCWVLIKPRTKGCLLGAPRGGCARVRRGQE